MITRGQLPGQDAQTAWPGPSSRNPSTFGLRPPAHYWLPRARSSRKTCTALLVPAAHCSPTTTTIVLSSTPSLPRNTTASLLLSLVLARHPPSQRCAHNRHSQCPHDITSPSPQLPRVLPKASLPHPPLSLCILQVVPARPHVHRLTTL